MDSLKNAYCEKDTVDTMHVVMYKYNCRGPGWPGLFYNVRGIRNLIIDKDITESEIHSKVLQDAHNSNNSIKCNIELLQSFEMAMKSKTIYNPLASIPFSSGARNTENNHR